jgi:hypothetical protein
MMDTRTSRVFACQSAHSSARAARLVRSLVAYTRPSVLLHVVHRAEGAPAANDDGNDGKSGASSSFSSSAISPARPLAATAATAASAQTAQMAIRGGVDRACLTLGPYAIAVPRQIALCARLPDEALLRTCSTSPTAEHARFPAELRALYGMMVALARGDLQPPFPLLAQRRFRRAWVPAPASPQPVPLSGVAAASSLEETLAAGEWRWIDSVTGALLDY